jgi:ribosomal protein L29
MKRSQFKKDIAFLNKAELETKALALASQIAKTRLQLAAGKVKNFKEVASLRKQLAVVKTKINAI